MKMQDAVQDPSLVAAMLAKFLPAGLGAAIMLLVEPPKTKRDWFVRLSVAFIFSYLFGEFAFDFAKSFSLFSFLDYSKHAHRSAVDGLVGASGFWVAGGMATVLRRFKIDPFRTAKGEDPRPVPPEQK